MLTLQLLGTLALAASVQEEPAPAPPPPLELLDHSKLTAALHALADSRKDVAQVPKLGHSRAGRAIEAVRLAGKDGDEPGRPAILLVANLEGPRVYASAVALQPAKAIRPPKSGR